MSKRKNYECPKCWKVWSYSEEEFNIAVWDKCCHECFAPDEETDEETP